ncbi:ATP-dependent helicase [Thermodesulfobacterium hydrogeniphilum]|uniref:ATP-dependent helicase n=1 Tax=Thermodesulfobacterium hydrogeniphilum TaxID=161156 RepID=UPI00056FBC37|nr:UvrD-helicase domain-containing protein [Thermodesulfobacterium hydrogeniphilum]
MKTMNFINELNYAQAEAVKTIFGPLLVIAGAGSGKTRTLTCRMAYLVAQGVSPEKILLLTFTRRASKEMVERAGALLKMDCNKIIGGTFHSLCQYMLRFYGYLLGYSPNFTILDRSDAEDLINLLRNSLGLAERKKRFPKKDTLTNIYSKIINQQKTLENILSSEYPQFLDYYPEIERLFIEYTNYKKEHQLMDYDDLLLNWLNILKSYPQVREEISKRFEFIMVDEYQDTNILQGEIIKYMGEIHQNVMVVGDDSQSIYGFRGANYKNIFEFPKLFPNTKIIKLEQNYRSTQAILDVANAIISNSKIKYTKNLFTLKKEGEKPILFFAKDETESSKFIADRILELREKGLKLSQIAVLFRSAFHSFDLEVELTKRGIPFVKYGGLKLLEAAHIKDIIAFLKIISNPKDFLSWNRALLLLEGIGPRTAEKIINLLKQNQLDMFFSLDKLAYQFPQSEFKVFINLLKDLQSSKILPSELLIKIWEFYKPIFERVYYEDYFRREKDIEGLIALSEKYKTLEEFLTDLVLEPIEVTDFENIPKDEDYLVLSTIHSAKGLEWHTVFILSLIEGRFPSLYSLQKEEELEEERRLFYVAVTRAREKLFFIAPMTVYIPGEGKILAKISRFIKEIPSDLINVYEEDKEKIVNIKGNGINKTKKFSKILSPFKVGDMVKHPHFGVGEVLEVLSPEKIKVLFPNKGATLLHLKYVKLERLIN